MDKLQAVYTLLSTSGLPVVYRAFPEGEAPVLPFICYIETGSDNFIADNKVYHRISSFNVELYTENKDPQTEALLEEILDPVVWSKDETYLEDEKCYMIVYSFDL